MDCHHRGEVNMTGCSLPPDYFSNSLMANKESASDQRKFATEFRFRYPCIPFTTRLGVRNARIPPPLIQQDKRLAPHSPATNSLLSTALDRHWVAIAQFAHLVE